MKKMNLVFNIVILGILFSACTNKKVISEKIVNTNKLYSESIIGLEDCADKVTQIKMDTNLRFMGAQYNNDKYSSELRMCKVDDNSVSIKIFKKEYINGREFDNESTYNGVLLQECGKENPIFINNSKLTVCKRKDGFTQVRVYRNLN